MHCFAAICGLKNSGKTTLTEKIIRNMTARGFRVAVLKHDGHSFDCDVPGTDSFRFVEAGAYGAAVLSRAQTFIRKKGLFPDMERGSDALRFLLQTADSFPEADVILAEGFKGLPIPKLEVVRGSVSRGPVSNPEGRFLVVSDLPEEEIGEPALPFEDIEGIVDRILLCGQVRDLSDVLPDSTHTQAGQVRDLPDAFSDSIPTQVGQVRDLPDAFPDSTQTQAGQVRDRYSTRSESEAPAGGQKPAVGGAKEKEAGEGRKEQMPEREFTHFDESGRARMVNVGEKDITRRTAAAEARVLVNRQTFSLIQSGGMKKGDVLGTAQIAGIMGAKRTPDLIPMCHPLSLEGIRLNLTLNEADCAVDIRAEVTCEGRTGVEMEALTAVSTAALTVYDMCKAVQRDMEITGIRLVKKTGGIHGDYIRS